MGLRQRPFKKPTAEESKRTTPDAKLKDPVDRFRSRHKDHDSSLDIPYWVSTGSVMLDCAISGGKGIPCGPGITVLVGDEATGKSVRLFLMMSVVQAHGGFVHGQDSEGRWNPGLASLTNVITDDPNKWWKNNPKSLEEALQNIEDFCDDIACSPHTEHERPKLIALDSIASLDPEPSKEDLRKGIRSPNKPMGSAALLNKFFRKKQIKLMRRRNVFIVWTNQLRDFVDMGAPMAKFAPKRSHSPGGRALRHATSVRIETSKRNINDVLLRAEAEENTKDFPAGDLLCYKVTKNVVGPPSRQAYTPWFFHMGADELLSMFQWLYDTGYITFTAGKGGGYSLWGHAAPRQEWLEHLYSDKDVRTQFHEYFKQAYLDLSLYRNSAIFGPE